MSINPSGLTLLLSLTRLLEPKPRLSISQWATQYAYLPKKGNAEPGKWRIDRLPYQAALLDDPLDPDVAEVAWMIGAQLVKTLSILIITGYYIHQEPSSILVLYPTLGDAESWSKDKFEPFRRECPVLRGLIQDHKRHTGDNTILNKNFLGGDLAIAGANSTSTLRQKSKRVILLDEVDGYKPNSEGDPIEQADNRALNFHNAVKIKASTPTYRGRSKIEDLYNRSDKQQWFCSCPECGHSQTLKWSQVKWTFTNADGAEESRPEDAVYVCDSCHAELTDGQRIEMILGGQWKATAPFNKVRGRHMSGLYRLIGKKRAFKSFLHEFAEGFLKSCKSREKLIVWTNTFLAETFEDIVERKDFNLLIKRAEPAVKVLPAPVRVLVSGADVQHNRIEGTIAGFSRTDEAWVIRRYMLEGNPHLPQIWKQLAQVLDQPYEHANGKRMWVNLAFVDSGGQSGRAGFNKPVYAFARPRQRLGRGGAYACKGVESNNGQIRREAFVSKKTILLQLVGTDETKSLIYSRLDIASPGPGYFHFCGDQFNAEYFQQLTAEEAQTVKVRGFTKRKWVKVRDRNEALDEMAYLVAALDKLNPDWSALDRVYGEEKKTEAAEPQAADSPALEQRKRVVRPAARPRRHLPFRRRR